MNHPHPIQVKGWTIYAHPLFLDQIEDLIGQAEQARQKNAADFGRKRCVKLLAAIAKLAFADIPQDPSRDTWRLGDTLGAEYKHWRRAVFYQQYRLFFRYHAAQKIIVYAWVNDDSTKRAYGSRSDAYAGFQRMLNGGNPPDDWSVLKAACVTADDAGRLAHAAEGIKVLTPP